jgi:hypothetical protein
MSKILETLNDRITVNTINGKAEVVAALQELREALLDPVLHTEAEIAASVREIQSNHNAQLYLNQRSLELVVKLCERFRV